MSSQEKKDSAVPLLCGDPEGERAASYTRFVLPFAYRLKDASKETHNAAGPRYMPMEPRNRLWREKYLTVETADVLFRRAGWYELFLLGQKAHLEANLLRDGRKIQICLQPPRLILFEKASRSGRDDGQEDLLSTGFLVLELYFPESDESHLTLDDLLLVNERFRYWQKPYEEHFADGVDPYGTVLQECPVDFLTPSRGRVGETKGCRVASYLDRWRSFLTLPLICENCRPWRLFANEWDAASRSTLESIAPMDGASPGWIVYADSRTFVWTCAIIKGGGGCLEQLFASPEHVYLFPGYDWSAPNRLKASRFGHWIKLLNVDQPGATPCDTHQSREFERKWADKRTYKRWQELGTFYGFNYHAGAMLGPRLGAEDPPLWRHFGQMYFDQALILLYLRISLFRFSTRLNAISAKARKAETRKGQEQWRSEFQDLRWTFALFTNLYQFPLLSNQQQAVEMYSLARKMMDVDDLFREVQEEIRSSHEYLATEEATTLSRATTRLTAIATLGAIPALAFSFLGMNILVSGDPPTDEGLFNFVGWPLLKGSLALFALIVVVVIILSREVSSFINWLAKPGEMLADWWTKWKRGKA